MKQVLIAGVVGGLILWVWGFLAWAILPLHTPSMHNIQTEDPVIEVMQNSMQTEGVYVFPAMPADMSDEAGHEAWVSKHKRGPVGMIIYNPDGSDPMMPSQMVVGFLIFVITASIAAWFLSRSTAAASPYMARVAYCGMIGIFISFISHLTAWNWMGFPFVYTSAMMIDSVLGWLLTGFGIAGIVKAPTE